MSATAELGRARASARVGGGIVGVLPWLCVVLLLSGAAGLIYQVTWVRLLGLSFGVTVFAISTVLAAFMAGLALGSVWGGRQADRVRRPLRVYGLVELGIGTTALLSPGVLAGLQEVYRALALAVDEPGLALAIAAAGRTVLAFALLLVPTGLMGATLPLAVRGARRLADTVADSRAMGLLYAFNTFGAIVGTLAAGFLLIGQLGMTTTITLAALGNGVAGLAAILLSEVAERDAAPGPRQAATADVAPHTRRPSQAAAAPGTHRSAEPAAALAAERLARVACLAFGASGAVSLAYEVVWSRVLAILFDSTVYGFVLMLATVLLGIALGSALAGLALSRRLESRAVGLAFGWLEVGIGLAAVFSLAAFGGVYAEVWVLRDRGPAWLASLLQTDTSLMAMLCLLTILPASLLMGATFPVAARLWAAGSERLGTRLGGVYAANVAGAIVGSLAAGFVLVPLLGAHTSLLVLAALNALIGMVVLRAAQGRAAVAVAGGLGAAMLLFGASRPPVHTLVFAQRHGDQELLWYQEGLESTVSVARDRESGTQILYTNSLGQSSDAPDIVRHHQRIGHLGALLAPRLDRVLVIGLGVGSTAGAVAQHAAAGVEIVELSPAVVPGARLFAHTNADVLQRPNVQLAIDDGRNHLLRTRQPYDLIVADIIHPYNAGGSNLYSVEYFRLVARALAPGGIMVQWVPLEDAEAHRLIVRTFLEVFPTASLWLSNDVLVGSNQPLRIDREAVNRRLIDPGAAATLGEVGFVQREQVMGQFRADAHALRAYVGPGPVLSDDRPRLEYFRSLLNP